VIRNARKYLIGREYFATIGVPILSGRAFRREDESTRVAIVSERLARECWKEQDALGRRIEIGTEGIPQFRFTGPAGGSARRMPPGETLEVVGVVKDVRDGLAMVAADAPPAIYLPLRSADYARSSLHGLTVIVRGMPGSDALGAVREVAAMDGSVTPFNARRMGEQIEAMMFPVRAALWTYGTIGVVGLILASVGLAGVTAYTVARRRREIGIRMALGARSADVLALVMREGAALLAVGAVIGLAGAWAGTRVMAAFLSTVASAAGTSTSDPALWMGAPMLLACLALAACYLPARRTVRIDPVKALRQE
jgi:ABC-type antimicrobial peptide transport system permease subunit